MCLNKSYFFSINYVKFPVFKLSTIRQFFLVKRITFLVVRTTMFWRNIQVWATGDARYLMGDSNVRHQ